MKYIYTVWFEDPSLPLNDQDREWPACFVIEAADAQEALAWGDHLASSYSSRSRQPFLSSSVEPFDSADLPGKETLPSIAAGSGAADSEIGW